MTTTERALPEPEVYATCGIRLLNYREASRLSTDEMMAYYHAEVAAHASSVPEGHARLAFWNHVSRHHLGIGSRAAETAARASMLSVVFALIAIAAVLIPLLLL